MNSICQFENTSISHLDEVVELQRACFPPPFPAELLWTRAHLIEHLDRFPLGQFVAVFDGVVGSASNLRIRREVWERGNTWDDFTGGHGFARHDAAGDVLFGADISIHPEWRRRGTARRFYEWRFELVRELGLSLYATVCRLPDFSASGLEDVEIYAGEVAEGRREDRTMTPLLRMGLSYRGVHRDGMDDPESGNAHARLEWRP